MGSTVEELEAKIARLEQEKQSLIEELLQNYEELNLAYELAEMFSNVFELKRLNDLILEKASEIAHANIGWIAAATQKEVKKIRIIAIKQDSEESLTPFIEWINEELTNGVLENGRKQIVNDINNGYGTPPLTIRAVKC